MRLLRQFNCVGIDAKNAAEWSSLYTGLPLAIVGALNLTKNSNLLQMPNSKEN
jgi:hypothetical protein